MTTLNPNEAETLLRRSITITRHEVALAKQYLMSESCPISGSGDALANSYAALGGTDFRQDSYLDLEPGGDMTRRVEDAARYLSMFLSANQGLWELIGEGYLNIAASVDAKEPNVAWKTQRTSSGWRFGDLLYAMPQRVIRSPIAVLGSKDEFLDPDTFALDAGLTQAHEEVGEAARDAVQCLRAQLFRPAVTMLGKAMEGAWVEFGLSTAAALNDDALNKFIVDPHSSISKIITRTMAGYRELDNRRSGPNRLAIRPQYLENAVMWSNSVRESRNAIHFGARPTVANSYDKVAVLFIHGADSLNQLYKAREGIGP